MPSTAPTLGHMSPATISGHGLRRVAVLAVALLATLPLGFVSDRLAAASAETLPLGDPDLAETRTSQTLGNGDSLTHIVRWTGNVQNRQTAASLPLEFINHPPVVPPECVNQPQCTAPGDVVQFTPEFSATTPSGPGVEVVLDRHGCVVRTAPTRGTPLQAG